MKNNSPSASCKCSYLHIFLPLLNFPRRVTAVQFLIMSSLHFSRAEQTPRKQGKPCDYYFKAVSEVSQGSSPTTTTAVNYRNLTSHNLWQLKPVIAWKAHKRSPIIAPHSVIEGRENKTNKKPQANKTRQQQKQNTHIKNPTHQPKII